MGTAMRYGVNSSIYAVENLDEYKFQRALYFSAIILAVYLFFIFVAQVTYKRIYQIDFIQQSKEFLREYDWYKSKFILLIDAKVFCHNFAECVAYNHRTSYETLWL
jgi:hypothetical protein